ncbi:sensor histidine kinase [Enterococcus rotai]|uniref:sensor histidine kinase n=1 Tax=Enterococcus rotai TaxID=118060 RepID=UPI0035C662D5
MKTRTKTFIFTSAVISIVITFSFALLYYFLPIVYERDQRNRALKSTDEVLAKIENQPLEKIKEIINVETSQGKTTWHVADSEKNTVYPIFVNRSLPRNLIITAKNSIVSIATATFKDSAGKKYDVKVSMLLEPVKEVKKTLLKVYPYILCVSFLIGGIGAYIYSYWATRRIHRITGRTKHMIALEESTDYVVKGKDEISELENNIQFLYLSLLKNIQSLNQELEKSNAIEHSKSEFMRIASHELKTPITAMLGIIEGMILNVGRFKDRDYYLNVCKEILESQSQLVQDVLFISKLESVEKFETFNELFSLTDLINETMGLFELMALQNKLTFEVDLSEVLINFNKEDMKRIIMNLLSNAVKYTKKGGEVTITLTSTELVIENQCVPLKPDDIDKIFLPFYRPDYARSRKDGGTGLGLYIVSKLLLNNDIPFTFKSVEDRSGMAFRLNLSSVVKNSK